MRWLRTSSALLLIGMALTLSACGGNSNSDSSAASAVDTDPPEVQLGERLFLETRFAEFFFANFNGDVNAPLASGDPVMNTSQTTGVPLPGPFVGQSMNCRGCHLVDELQDESGGGVRTYCDFARRSPVPQTNDGLVTTPRNSPPLVNATLTRGVPTLLHFDGEFASLHDLIIGTMTGRNFGWAPNQAATAISHIANVIRNDDGSNDLAKSFGGGGVPFSELLLGTNPRIPRRLRIPAAFRIDVSSATDQQIIEDVAALIGAYVDSLRFATDDDGFYIASPYDVFLKKNGLPRGPNPGETELAYSQRLLGLVSQISAPVFVTPKDGKFKFHQDQKFQFGAIELEGLKIFFKQPANPGDEHSGNCVACHTPPNFTDFQLHNTGASQLEYDAIFGSGAFAALSIPSIAVRNADFDLYLPPSANHPGANSRFRSPASLSDPGNADLGVWNIVGNPDIPAPQQAIMDILCTQFQLTGAACNADALLPLAIAYFKTPTLRDLGQSNPYLHNGSLTSVDDVVTFYVTTSRLAQQHQLRNAAPELSNMFIDQSDVAALSAFLNALNEDYN